MEYRLITKKDEGLFAQMLSLRHKELRQPLGLDLYTEDLRDEKDQFIFVGLENNEVVVCLLLKPLNEKALKLRQMATLKSKQGNGLGSALIHFAEKWAIQNGYKSISLHAREYAIPFYEKLDFKIEGGKFEEVGIPHLKMNKLLY